MVCTLYYAQGGKQMLNEITNVQEHRHNITFTFANGSKLDVIRNQLLHYELRKNEAGGNTVHVQDVFNRFDDFVSNFVTQVEHAVYSPSRYSISVNEIEHFKKLLNNCRKPKVKEVAKFRSLEWI